MPYISEFDPITHFRDSSRGLSSSLSPLARGKNSQGGQGPLRSEEFINFNGSLSEAGAWLEGINKAAF